MSEKVTVEGNADKLEYFDWHLEKLGLSRESETIYSGNFDSGEEISRIVNFCIRNKFEYSLGNNPATGRYSYRTEFFKHNPPNARGKYRCVYCGKWFDEDRIVVDHIYPASRVASNPSLQKKMKKMGINNVNFSTVLRGLFREKCKSNWKLAKESKKRFKRLLLDLEANYEIKSHFNFWIDFIYHLFKPIGDSEV